MRRIERALVTLLALTSTGASELPGQAVTVAGRTVAAAASIPADTLLIEIRLDGVGQALAKAVTIDGALYVPAAPVAQLAGITARPGELLGLEALRIWLGTDVRYDAADLVLTIAPVPSMPAVARASRARDRARLATSVTAPPVPVRLPSAAGVLAIDYDVFGNSAAAEHPSYVVRAGMGLLGGELAGLVSTAADPEVAWTLQRPGTPVVSRLQLGASHTSGMRPRMVHGVSIGNAPFFRPAVLDVRTLGGRLPAGWTVDAWRGGRLFAYDTVGVDGRFAVPFPVTYGENTVDLVAYGPNGERVTLREFLRLAPAMLAAGQSEYAVTIGRCAAEDCELAGSARLRAGLTRAITVEGGLHYERANGDGRLVPFGTVTASPGHGLGAEFEAYGHTMSRLSARFEPSALSGVEVTWLNYPSTSGSLLAGVRSLALDAWASISSRPGVATVRGQVRHVPDAAAPRIEVTLGSSHAVGATHWRPYTSATYESGAVSSASGLEAIISTSPRLLRWFRNSWLRTLAELDHSAGIVRRMEATLSRQVARDFRLEGDVQWNRAHGTTMAVRVVTHTRQLRAAARTSRRRTGPGTSWDYTGGGSVVVDPGARRVLMSSEPSMGRGGLAISAFLDENADGVRQPDEPPVANVIVVAGSQSLQTDDAGRAHLWGAPAHEPLLVRVDSTSIPPHWHVPPVVPMVLQGARIARLDLPITPGSTLEGRVQLDGVDPATITIWLVNRRSRVQDRVELFRDGSFYLMSVRPGAYALVVRSAVGPAVALQEVLVEVPASKAPTTLANITLQLSSRPRNVLPRRPPQSERN